MACLAKRDSLVNQPFSVDKGAPNNDSSSHFERMPLTVELPCRIQNLTRNKARTCSLPVTANTVVVIDYQLGNVMYFVVVDTRRFVKISRHLYCYRCCCNIYLYFSLFFFFLK